jgi:hypothetical protein
MKNYYDKNRDKILKQKKDYWKRKQWEKREGISSKNLKGGNS